MILNGDSELTIGQRYVAPVTDGEGVWHEMPFVVLRVASIEEYREYCRVEGRKPLTEPLCPYTYEVSMD